MTAEHGGAPYLKRMKITSFGAFANKVVGPFTPHLNVVFGENEAGKSTLASFAGGVLFGWEEARGVRNTYKPRNADRAGSLFFAPRPEEGDSLQGENADASAAASASEPGVLASGSVSESENELVLSRVRNADGLQGPVELVDDIDRETFQTMFSLTADELRSLRSHCGKVKPALCVFEYIYFARPDSVIDGCSVHLARQRAGSFLALEHPVQADVVIGVPDSGLDAAIGFSRQSGIPYGIGFIKNKYIGRTFIQPSQAMRENSVRIKLNVLKSTVEGKRVVMVDDSIVRGTTSKRIVSLLRHFGATEVHVRSSAPPFMFPCYFGTDVPSKDQLVACNYTMDGIKELIGADSIGFLSVNSLEKIIPNANCQFCDGCFSGKYPVDVD